MTLWDRRFGLIIGLALFTFACEDPGEIGLELNPGNGAFIAKYDEIPISSSVVQFEDILSDNSTRIDNFQNPTSGGRLLAGSYSTPDFGKFESKAFSSLYLAGPRFKEGDLIFDSLVMNVRVDYIYGENFTDNKRIYVHELAEAIEIDTLYLTKNSTPYVEEPIGMFEIDISSFDSTRVDTTFRTTLSADLGKRFLDQYKADTNTFQNNNSFREFFNGFALVSDEANEAVVGIHAESQSTFFRLYYHNTVDTTFYDFILQGLDTTGLNITRYYNNITLDRSGTPIAGIPGFHEDFQTDNELSYIQGSSGIFTKLNLGPYLNFLDTIEHLVINGAELVIPIENYNDYLQPSTSLDLYLTDESNKFVEIIDTLRSETTYAIAGRLLLSKDKNENRGQFAGNITGYIQSITSGQTSDSLLLIGQSNLWNSVLTVNQSVISKENISLNIYYSVLQ